MKKDVILLTGATGMVGRALLEEPELINNHIIKATTRNPENKIKNADQVLVGNLADYSFTERAVRKCDTIIHCAAENRNHDLYKLSNVDAVHNLVKTANLNNIKKFIHISTVKVIGHTSDKYIDEKTPCSPSNFYEQTKYEGEKIVLNECRATEKYILRPSFVFDKRRIEDICQMNHLRILLKGNETTNLVYVKNVTAAIIYALNNKLHHPIYNISTDDLESITFRQFLRDKLNRNIIVPSMPIKLVHTLRRLKNGYSSLGNKHYQSELLRNEGFAFPYNLYEAIENIYQEITTTY